MGRPKLPENMQKGHLTNLQKTEKQLEEQNVKVGMEQLDNPPMWLRDGVAKKEWKRLVEQFKTIEIITNLDLNNLGAYCNAYSAYLETTKQLKGQPLTVEYTNKGGATNIIENPLIKIQIKYSDEMKRFSSLLGLTIDSRLKIGAIILNKTKDEVKENFGDI